jgi:hypothetical protein
MQLSATHGATDLPAANMAARKEAFSIAKLPKTLRDAILVTSNLDINHIWIDSLCIVQDDRNDWQGQASKLGSIYSQAQVTLAADCSASSTSGLFNRKSVDHLQDWKSTYTLEGDLKGRPCTLLLDSREPSNQWTTALDEGSLSTRAWCFQENVLSPRILHFTKTQLIWECVHCVRSEDNFIQSELYGGPIVDVGQLHWLKQLLLNHDRHPSLNLPKDEIVFSSWYDYLVSKDYAWRHLTNPSDKLVAIGGVASLLRETLFMDYYAGIWGYRIVEGLSWMRQGPGGKAVDYRAPSWSWASQDSGVGYAISHYASAAASVTSSADILEVQTEGVDGTAFSTVKSAAITMRFAAVQGRCLDRHFSDPYYDKAITEERAIVRQTQSVSQADLAIPGGDTFIAGVTQQKGMRLELRTESNLKLLALLDNDHDELRDLDVMVCFLFQYMNGPDYFFMLLVPSKTAGCWERIGLARPFHYGPESVEPEVMLAEFNDARVQTFVVV